MKKWVTDKSGKLIQIDDGKPEASTKKSSSGASAGKASSSQKSTSGTSSAAKGVGKSLYTPKSDNYGSGYIYSVGGPQNLSDEDKWYYSVAAGKDIASRQGTAAGLRDNFNSLRYQRDAAKQIKQGNYVQKKYSKNVGRDDAVKAGMENVRQYADRTSSDGAPMMYIKDLGQYVAVGNRSLRHGLGGRRTFEQIPVIAKAGDILRNAIVVNEADPKYEGREKSWILLSAARAATEELVIVRGVVDKLTSQLTEINSLYAIYGKKKRASRTSAADAQQKLLNDLSGPTEAGRVVTAYEGANGSSVPSSLTISIADLLEGVNGLFDDVISEDVANRLGIERSESEFTERLRFQQRDPGQISDRELLATALQNVTQNADEWDNLRRYKRFKEWSESGLIEKIFHELGEDADLQDISIDSTYIKTHKASAGAERGGPQNPMVP